MHEAFAALPEALEGRGARVVVSAGGRRGQGGLKRVAEKEGTKKEGTKREGEGEEEEALPAEENGWGRPALLLAQAVGAALAGPLGAGAGAVLVSGIRSCPDCSPCRSPARRQISCQTGDKLPGD